MTYARGFDRLRQAVDPTHLTPFSIPCSKIRKIADLTEQLARHQTKEQYLVDGGEDDGAPVRPLGG